MSLKWVGLGFMAIENLKKHLILAFVNFKNTATS
jgi:hypothetical protein